jgi:ComF family protein
LIKKTLHDFINLFYPRLCAGCGNSLLKNENCICVNCHYQLPRTGFYKNLDNAVAQIFWGRVKIENALALFYFQKGNRIQNIMHRLKYKGEHEIGFELGKLLASELLKSDYSNIDVIIPVPLTKKKLKQRGYNQSEYIAKGIAELLDKPVITDALIRQTSKGSQTQKNRYERWLNTEDHFKITNAESLSNKHILLVDDIITTGATLEACASVIFNATPVKISIASLAYAMRN